MAILLDYIGGETSPMDEDLRDAIRHHQDFKRRYVASWDDTWELPVAGDRQVLAGRFLRARLYRQL